MSDAPNDLRYSRDHLWVRVNADTGLLRAGVTDFAQQSVGDVVEVTLPEPGVPVTAGDPCGEIESTKSVNDLIAPVSGTIRTRNDELDGQPELVNADPYGQGWMFDVEIDPSACSVRTGIGLTDAAPGSARATYLTVTDIEAACQELAQRGIGVSGIRHKSPVENWQGDWKPGVDPQRRDYASLAEFADPDGNTWVLQEIGSRPKTPAES